MTRIYTINGCQYCQQLKELLKQENIEFFEVNVDENSNENEYKLLTEITKSNDVPTIKVGKHILVPNVSFFSIEDAVSLIKDLSK